MAQRRAWFQEEDEALKELVENRQITKWCRNGKQCRERYHNHLDPRIKKEKWSDDEERHLFDFHSKWGNKWAQIAQHITGRSDNAIKNHFFSLMRRSIHHINRIIANHLKRECRPLKVNFIYKIIQFSESRFKESNISPKAIEACIEIKQSLTSYAFIQENTESNPQVISAVQSLIKQINTFNKNYKRKAATSRQQQNDNMCAESSAEQILEDESDPKVKVEREVDQKASSATIAVKNDQTYVPMNVSISQARLSEQYLFLTPTSGAKRRPMDSSEELPNFTLQQPSLQSIPFQKPQLVELIFNDRNW